MSEEKSTDKRILYLLKHGCGGPEMCGAWIMKELNLKSEELYVSLFRLENTGKILSRWVDGPYPRSRVYRISLNGIRLLESTD